MGYYFHCSPFIFDDVEFFEFVWQYERLSKEKDSERKQPNASPDKLFFGGT